MDQDNFSFIVPGFSTEDEWNSMVTLQKMFLVYNSVIGGWTVRMLEDGRFEFQKGREKLTSSEKTTDPKDFLKNFLHYYMKIDENSPFLNG